MDFDEDGYYATLLDLHRRKNISITEKGEGKGVIVRSGCSPERPLIPYEQRVLDVPPGSCRRMVSLIPMLIEALAKKAQMNSTAEEKALQYQRSLTDVTSRADTMLSTQYIVDGRDHIVPLAAH